MGKLRNNRNGFTMIEILIMVLVLGILAMAGMPVITSTLGHGKLSSAGRIMVAAIEYTANLSVRYQRPFQFHADTGKNSFKIIDTDPSPDKTVSTIRLDNQPPVNADNSVFNPVLKKWYDVKLDETEGLSGVSIDSGPEKIFFYPDGHSTDNYSTSEDSRYVLSFGSLSNTITINRISGRISVE